MTSSTARVSLPAFLVACGLTSWCAAAEPVDKQVTPEQAAFFEAKVRPILAEHCFGCHGEKKQESGLRLDGRDAAMKGSAAGPVIVPGKPDDSELVLAIRYDGPVQMPPDGKLADGEIALLTKWVEQGAGWPAENGGGSNTSKEAGKDHWAFQPPERPAVPAVQDDAWPRTPIDRFVLARLEEKQLRPSPRAEGRTLIRRATFDLIGLPPTPEEVAAFEADESPDAFARLVERLLASPRYGERWGRHWLDVARYADTKGYVFFEEKEFPWAWTYRDYVIESFNADLPYDDFVRQQLAADQLDLDEDKSPLRALAFLTVGSRFMGNQHDIHDDRIDVVTRGLMGLTVTCARCHDHKFDPIPAADYYALYGVFRSSEEPTIAPLYAPPPSTEQYRKFDAELQARLAKLNEFIETKHGELVNGARERVAEYLTAAHDARDKPTTEDFMFIAEKGDLNPMMIVRWKLYLERSRKAHDPVWAPWQALAELPVSEFAEKAPAALAELVKANDGERPLNPLVIEALTTEAAGSLHSMKDVAERYAAVLGPVDKQWRDELQQAASANRPVPEGLDDPHAEALRRVFYGEGAPPNVPRMLGWGFLELLPDRESQDTFEKLIKAVNQWAATGEGAPPRAMVLVDQEQPYQPRIFLRGNPHRLGEEVTRHAPTILGDWTEPFTEGSGRRQLAEAVVDRRNPLTARVMVNRIWQQHFGQGIVATPSDFGLRSDAPSHPELLDWLAIEFVESGWSVKHLHRLIMNSAAYQQASTGHEEAVAETAGKADPENRLLWRQNRRRLGFEGTRDTLLSASGSLDSTIGGPSVDILKEGEFNTRRTLYGHLDRLNVPGLFTTFDFPNPAATTGAREETTVPPQALYLMNNPYALEAGKRLIERPDVAALSEPAERIERLHRILYGRGATEHEQMLAVEFLKGSSDDDAERWRQLAQALLMANEFVFVD